MHRCGIYKWLLAFFLALSALGCESILGIEPIEPTIDAGADGAVPDAGTDGAVSDAGADDAGSDAIVDPAWVLDVEAEAFDQHVSLDRMHNWFEQTQEAGFFGASYMEPMPEGSNCADQIESCGALLRYEFIVADSGDYYVHWHLNTEHNGDDSFNWNIDDASTNLHSADNDGPHGVWKWRSTPDVKSLDPGPHTLYLWMRESGIRMDRMIITQDPAPGLPVGPGGQ